MTKVKILIVELLDLVFFMVYPVYPQLWSRGNIIASHLAGPGSIPAQVSFPGWGFSSTAMDVIGFFFFLSKVWELSRFRTKGIGFLLSMHNVIRYIYPAISFGIFSI